jgi:hypothetical protein
MLILCRVEHAWRANILKYRGLSLPERPASRPRRLSRRTICKLHNITIVYNITFVPACQEKIFVIIYLTN